MKYFSMFSGIGGFELGIGERGECIGYSEIDKYAIAIYERHFKHRNYGDATKISELPDFDWLVGGFPCQAFSIAGKRRGFDESRGTLFFDIARILQDKKPKHFLLENVKGLLSHDQGRTFQTIIGILSNLGYFVQWQVLNSKNFGVPQNRERVFFIGSLRGECEPKILSFGENGEFFDKRQRQIPPTITQRYYKQGQSDPYIVTEEPRLIEITSGLSDAQRIYDSEGISKTLKGLGGGMGAKTGLYAIPLKFMNRNQRNYQGEYSFTIDSLNTGGIINNSRVRRLTPIECERLQGFPDNWTEGVSDTQRYKVLGNAVTVNVIKAIFDNIGGVE